MNEKRLDWLDVAKGYGILFVIYAHTDYGFIGNLLYTFHVPLFFFLSGFVFSNKYDFKTFCNYSEPPLAQYDFGITV